MAKINDMILSEINNASDCTDELKEFINWIIEFERKNSDRELFAYKAEIEKMINRILVNKNEKLKNVENK